MPRSNAVKKETAKPQGKVRPVRSTRQFVEAAEQPIGHARPRRMNSRGPARESLEPSYIERVDRPVSKEKLALLAFMEEPVTVVVHESTDVNADQMPTVWNDGRPQRFMRGREQTVKRKYIETLARSKRTTYSQKKVKDENTGVETYVNIPHTALQFPFTVTEDANPKGKAWLQSILSSA